MPQFQIEMIRECSICKFIRPGLTDYCFNCGSPKSEADKLSFPDNISENDALHGKKYIRAVSGPDWNCKFCSKLQNNTGRFCEFCGSSRDKIKNKFNYIHKSNDNTAPHLKKQNTKDYNFAVSTFLTNSNNVDLGVESVNFKNNGRYKIFAIIIATLALLSVGFYFAFRTKIVDARVVDIYWERNVSVERYQLWLNEGWDPGPNAVDIQFDRKKIHHYDHVKIGSHIEKGWSAPYDCHCKMVKGKCNKTKITCTSNKNGSARCSGGDEVCDPDQKVCDTCRDPIKKMIDDYRDDPVYKNWYTWKTWNWGYNRNVQTSGNDFEPLWPNEEDLKANLQNGEQERFKRMIPIYRVTFMESEGSDTHIFNPSSEEEFKKYPKGKVCKLKVNFAAGMEILSCN